MKPFGDSIFRDSRLCTRERLCATHRGLPEDDRLRAGQVSRGEQMLYSGTNPESYITECTSVYED